MAIMLRGNSQNLAQETDISNAIVFAGTNFGGRIGTGGLVNGVQTTYPAPARSRQVERILVGDENGIAREVYTRPQLNYYKISSFEEFYEKATADPYGYFELEPGTYYGVSDPYKKVQKFCGVLDGANSRMLEKSGYYMPIYENYGTVKRFRCYNGGLMSVNYGRVTQCYFKQFNTGGVPIMEMKKYSLVDNCLVYQLATKSGVRLAYRLESAAGICGGLNDSGIRFHCCLAVTKGTENVAPFYSCNGRRDGPIDKKYRQYNYTLAGYDEVNNYSYRSQADIATTFWNAGGKYISDYSKWWQQDKLVGLDFETMWGFKHTHTENGKEYGRVYLQGMGYIEDLVGE